MICSRSAIEQEDEWGSDEFYDEEENNSDEKPPEEDSNNHSENDETNLISSPCTAVKNYCKAQGVTDADIMYFEREVKDMMETVRNLQTTLSEGARIDDVFGETGKQGCGKRTSGEDDVKASIEEIEKMDAVLRVKAAEERRAKLCRIQAEEESRDVLSKLPCAEVSNGIKVNLEEFIRLLNDLEETGSGSSCAGKLGRVDGPGDEERKEDDRVEEGKAENGNGERRKTRNFKFVEKNIKLAKCGRGTLSLTDEEKLRIEELLMEAEDSGGERPKERGRAKEIYAMDEETKSVLRKIEEQLEAVTEGRGAERWRSKASLLEKWRKEDGVEDEGKTGEKKRRSRLAEINKLLKEVSSVCEEEMSPLSEEEMGSLLEEGKRNVGREGDEGEKSLGVEGSEDVMSELVSNAELLMPKFKYRFGK